MPAMGTACRDQKVPNKQEGGLSLGKRVFACELVKKK